MLQALTNVGESVKQKIRGRVVIKVNTIMEDELLSIAQEPLPVHITKVHVEDPRRPRF